MGMNDWRVRSCGKCADAHDGSARLVQRLLLARIAALGGAGALLRKYGGPFATKGLSTEGSSGGRLWGKKLHGESRSVSGTATKDGSVSGHLLGPHGRQVGVFWGQRVGNTLNSAP
jgi:hypothetical protein